MLKQLINFYKVSSPRPCNGEALSSSDARRLKFLKLLVTVCIMCAVLA